MAAVLYDIPIVLITFNRPDVTRKILDRILEINPARLYFFNDAPREGNENDRIRTREIREMASGIQMEGQLFTRFEERNLGCKIGESTAMTWLFDNEEMGIVIEDDTYPTLEFFQYCRDMLYRYKDDDRIFSISGCNLLNEWKADQQDYFFSLYGSFWGWAGWRRAWKHYNVNMPEWNDPKVREMILQYLPTEEFRKLRTSEFDSLVSGMAGTWDFQFCFYHYYNHALSIVPSRNMVTNLGINRPDAVHMKGESPYEDLRSFPVRLPFRENSVVVPDYGYDVSVVRKAHPYFYETPVYPDLPSPTPMQRVRMAIGAAIGEKGPLRSLTNFLLGRK